MQHRMLLAALAARAHCWLMLDLLFTRTQRSFSVLLHSSQLFPKRLLVHGLFLPCAGHCLSLCWTSWDASSPFLQVIKVPLNSSTYIWSVIPSSQFCIFFKLASYLTLEGCWFCKTWFPPSKSIHTTPSDLVLHAFGCDFQDHFHCHFLGDQCMANPRSSFLKMIGVILTFIVSSWTSSHHHEPSKIFMALQWNPWAFSSLKATSPSGFTFTIYIFL